MNKKLLTFMLVISAIVSIIPVPCVRAAGQIAEAAYGTPVIDGEIDEVWSKTNAYIVEHCHETKDDMYKGWFKVLWDEDYIYVLAKSYSTQLDDSIAYGHMQDSFDAYFDEDMDGTNGYETDDYQVRTNYKSEVSGNNYPDFSKIIAAAKPFDMGFVGEMAIPLTTKNPSEGLELGFEVLMTASQTPVVERRQYLWNTSKDWVWNNTGCFGKLVLKKNVAVKEFSEPQWVAPKLVSLFKAQPKAVSYSPLYKATVNFDSDSYKANVLEADDYPLMSISELARVIGGTYNGNTLTKGDVSIKYTANSYLAEFGNGHLMLEREPVYYGSDLYVPVSSVVPTMIYTMHYNKFDKVLEIKTGSDYPDTEVVLYAKDYGAVGDGIHEDGKAIKRAINAALATQKPSKVVLEPNKTYLIGPNQESYAFIKLENVENFILDGQGSLILFEKPVNNFMEINSCTNVKVTNLDVDYKELTFTQGRAISIDNNKFILDIEEGFPLPASDEWVKNFYTDSGHGGWWFTQIMDAVEPRFKYTNHYDIFIDSIHHVKDRQYEVTVKTGYESKLAQAEVGDRFVINTRSSAYDVGDKSHYGLIHGNLWIYKSGDITIENVNLYSSLWHPVNIGSCWGRVKFINYGMITKEGRLMSGNSDGMHCYNNREGIVLDGCTMMNNLDDQINTNANSMAINSYDGEYTYVVGRDTQLRVGDEVLFVNLDTHKTLGNAFVKSFEYPGNGTAKITIDRKIDGLTLAELSKITFYNLNESTKGSVIKNSKFMYSRRYGWLTKNANSLFDNNYIFENGGSAISASDEKRGSHYEGPFPAYFTMRNNTIIAPDQMPPDYPVQIQTMTGKTPGESANVKNFLIENNTIDSGRNAISLCINSVDGLYLINNKLISDKTLKNTNATPVLITNSRVAMIDGIDFNFKQSVDAVVTMSGCKVNESDIKNITINEGNTSKPYIMY